MPMEARDIGALKMLAWSLWSDAWIWHDPNGQKRNLPNGEFVEKMSAMLRSCGET
jgi:hypothetical protein